MSNRNPRSLPEQLALELTDRPQTHLYVASALTALDEAERQEIGRLCDIIDQTVVSETSITGRPWHVHLPVVWSAPSPTATQSPRDVYFDNCDHVARASGLIVVADRGGSLGAGQEFAWALALRLPILVVTTDSSPISRQISGTPALTRVRSTAGDEDLRATIVEWLADWGDAIESRARNGGGERVTALRAVQRLRAAFDTGSDSIEAIAAVANLTVDRIRQLFKPEALFACSVSELIALSGALGLEAGDALNPHRSPELTPNQRSGLAITAAEYEWAPQRVLQVEARARLELARGGTRRLPLSSIQDWVQFARRFIDT